MAGPKLHFDSDKAIVDPRTGAPTVVFSSLHQAIVRAIRDVLLGLPTIPSGVLITDAAGVPAFSAILPAVDGNALVNLNASQLLTGTIPIARIGTHTVTLDKLIEIASSRLLGRSTAGVGDIEVLEVGAGLQLLAGVLSATIQPLLTEDPSTPADDTVWYTRTGARPAMAIDLKVRVGGETLTLPQGTI